jgi:glucokinase
MPSNDAPSNSRWRLVCDLGGTNVRFACADGAELSGRWSAPLAGYSGFGNALAEALAQIDRGMPDSVAVGAAGPVDGQTIRLTNAPWVLEASHVSRACGDAKVLFFNDLQPVARAIPALEATELETLRDGSPASGAARLAINVGTGFGAAVLHETLQEFLSCPTEAGHMAIPAALFQNMPEAIGRKANGIAETVEDFLSGAGVVSLYTFLAGSDHPLSRHDVATSAATVFASAQEDPISSRICESFGYGLGLAVRDLILAHAAWGGVYLFGSVINGWVGTGRLESFHHGLSALGAMEDRITRVPVHRIARDDAALLGLALF